jgi:hypothetical protein
MSESKLQINAKKDDTTDNACPEVSNVFPYKITGDEEDKEREKIPHIIWISGSQPLALNS